MSERAQDALSSQFIRLLCLALLVAGCSGSDPEDVAPLRQPIADMHALAGTWQLSHLHPRQSPPLYEFAIGQDGSFEYQDRAGQVTVLGEGRIQIEAGDCGRSLVPSGIYQAWSVGAQDLVLSQTFNVAPADTDRVRARWIQAENSYEIRLREDGTVVVDRVCRGYYENWPNMDWAITFGMMTCQNGRSPIASGAYALSETETTVVLSRSYTRLD